MVHGVASETRAMELRAAAQAVTVACQQIDSPEQRAEDALDRAITMLETRQYRAMLERFTIPVELAEMRSSGRIEQMVARFESGWGNVLLQKLKLARSTMPTVNRDGAITYSVPGTQDALTHPITLVEIAGAWYFRD